MLQKYPIQDSAAMATRCQQVLNKDCGVLHNIATENLLICKNGQYTHDQNIVDIRSMLQEYKEQKRTFFPLDRLVPSMEKPSFAQTDVWVCNDTTLAVARKYHERGQNALALNFANGTHAGGGFLHGARAQEESICYKSSLYDTLEGDDFYRYHMQQGHGASSSACIVSRAVVFRDEEHALIPVPWTVDVITAAAPICTSRWNDALDRDIGAQLMHHRIYRVLELAKHLGYAHLILGAWGCGAFSNDIEAVAESFLYWLEDGCYAGAFQSITFAVVDWSDERRFLEPFAKRFCV